MTNYTSPEISLALKAALEWVELEWRPHVVCECWAEVKIGHYTGLSQVYVYKEINDVYSWEIDDIDPKKQATGTAPTLNEAKAAAEIAYNQIKQKEV